MKTIATALAALLIGGAATGAHADTFATFNVAGLIGNGETVGGVLTLDVTTGTLQSAAVTLMGPLKDTLNVIRPAFQGQLVVGDSNASTTGYSVLLSTLPSGKSFAGYNGGPVVGQLDAGPDFNSTINGLSLTAATATDGGGPTAVPEPNAAALLATALFGLSMAMFAARAVESRRGRHGRPWA